MHQFPRHRPAVAALVAAAAAMALPTPAAAAPLPRDHTALASTIDYPTMMAFLAELPHPAGLTVEVEEAGRSVQGRVIPLVHLAHAPAAPWRVLLYAQQHGDEVSGKDAILYLVQQIVEDPSTLPHDVDLWLMPSVNPDGGAANQRRNAAGADLNRDHLLLDQPETRALHRVARRVLPHVAVDCHEFTRDSRDFTRRGWLEWPIIMMDTANLAILPDSLYDAGVRWVDEAGGPMRKAGHNYVRYHVGGAPPDEEQRYSTLEANDGRNGIGVLGGLSFIIEAGVRRGAEDPAADLGERVDAYLVLLRRFLDVSDHRAADIAAVDAARRAALPPFVPTNVFWANAGPRITQVPVIELATGATVEVPTANFMHDRIVKWSVPTPAAYLVDTPAAEAVRTLLDRHDVAYTVLAGPRRVTAERCSLVRVEEELDEVYNRYEGRQIVARAPAAEHRAQAGALLVGLDQPHARQAVLLLEPTMLYGLFGYPEYRALVAPDGTVPIWRVTEPAGEDGR